MITPPDPVKLFIAVLLSPSFPALDEVVAVLTADFGAVELQSPPQPFEGSSYYEPEMGPGLQRIFLSFTNLISPGRLAEIKLRTIEIEDSFSCAGNRRVNLDPGYLDFNKVVLASTKFGGQKIYLDHGIYADLMLFFYRGRFDSFAWSFPDFRDGCYDSILRSIRDRYRDQRRGSTPK